MHPFSSERKQRAHPSVYDDEISLVPQVIFFLSQRQIGDSLFTTET
jgi:hypothetical protein